MKNKLSELFRKLDVEHYELGRDYVMCIYRDSEDGEYLAARIIKAIFNPVD